MGFWDDLKYRREAKKEYQEQVASVKADIARHLAAEPGAKQKLDKLVEIRETGAVDWEYFCKWDRKYLERCQADPAALERAIGEAERDYMRGRQSRLAAEKSLQYLRPNTREDTDERRAAYETFAKEVLTVDPVGELDLRFHATTLVATRDIIASGGLMSSVDRLDGFMETTNASNEISVSDIQNIQYSLDYWMDMGMSGYNGCRPCGCMFVLQPRTQEEADMIPGRQMHNVLFHEHPEQLVAIVTTSENVEKVQGWLREAGIFMDDVYRFDEFAAALENMKDALVPEYRKVQEKEVVDDSLVSSVSSVISDAKQICDLRGAGTRDHTLGCYGEKGIF